MANWYRTHVIGENIDITLFLAALLLTLELYDIVPPVRHKLRVYFTTERPRTKRPLPRRDRRPSKPDRWKWRRL
jgi:hypothetical protein